IVHKQTFLNVNSVFLTDLFVFFTCQLHKYHYIGQKLNWTDAQRFCREFHTDLATVSSTADMDQLRSALEKKMKAWIGLHNSNTWRWSLSGLHFNESDTKWGSGEPKDGKNCGAIWKNSKTSFVCVYSTDKDGNSSKKRYFFGQKNTWYEAQEYCEQEQTGLVATNVIMKSLLNICRSDHIFIGLIRNTFAWSDGSRFSFTFWDPKKTGNKDCIMMNDNGELISEDFPSSSDHVILIKENRTWEEALYYCRHHHHDLVTITNMDEQRWVQGKTKNASSPFVWTGLRYTCSLGFWFWVSDEVVHYKNWASPEQVNECDMSGAMQTGGKHKWFKKHDEEKFNFFCSK
uniref:C-type lectin domain-containing protein n=1 Tax=Oryzias latipes TaxID=8090 RepID=A0A3P9IBW4_ORYLA